jgi:hypothetical protein
MLNITMFIRDYNCTVFTSVFYTEINSILQKCYWTLMLFYVSLHSSVNEDDFEQEINLNYRDLNYHIYKEHLAN